MSQTSPLIKRLVGRADAHDKMCFGSPMGLGYFSGNDARLLRDAADLLRGVAQTPAEPHETTYLRGWNEGVEQAAEVADEMAAAQRATNEKYPEHARSYATWRGAVLCYQEVAKQIRALSDTSTSHEGGK